MALIPGMARGGAAIATGMVVFALYCGFTSGALLVLDEVLGVGDALQGVLVEIEAGGSEGEVEIDHGAVAIAAITLIIGGPFYEHIAEKIEDGQTDRVVVNLAEEPREHRERAPDDGAGRAGQPAPVRPPVQPELLAKPGREQAAS